MNETLPPRAFQFGVRDAELRRFAAWFGKDWRQAFPNFLTGARLYVGRLAFEERIALADELAAFLRRTKDHDGEALQAAWLELGARDWQHDLEVRDTLRTFVEVALA